MVRKIVAISQEICNGCGICVEACAEHAIALINEKAVLLRDDYCDGLGDCLPTCPVGAISFVERESIPFDPSAVAVHMGKALPFVCLKRSGNPAQDTSSEWDGIEERPSKLRQWPIQIKMLPIDAECFDRAHILISADCAAYTYASFHERFMDGRVVLIGCPKVDEIDYVHKLTEIVASNEILSITLVWMEMHCCDDLETAVRRAAKNSRKLLPLKSYVISREGKILA